MGDLPEDRVGCVLWWSASNVKIDPQRLRSELASSCPRHLDLVRNPVEPKQAMRRAMRRRQGAAMLSGWRWEEVSDDDRGLCLTLALGERDVAAQEYRASTMFTVLVKADGAIDKSATGWVLTSEQVAAFDALVERYRLEAGSLTQEDVRGLVVKIILERANGRRLKDGGSVYFVPRGEDEVIDQLKPALALAGMHLVRFPVAAKDGASIEQLTGEIERGLAEEASELEVEVSRKLAELQSGKAVRAEGLATRLEEAAELRAKARLYKELLGISVENINHTLLTAEAVVRMAQEQLQAKVAA